MNIAARTNSKKKTVESTGEKQKKRALHDSDSDSDFTNPPPKKQKIEKKGNLLAVVEKYPSIRTRTSPKTLFTAIQSLNDSQKKSVIEMGFGSLLSMKLDGIPAKLGFFVVDNFNPESMEIILKKGVIKIIKEDVHDAIGVPMGAVNLMSFQRDGFDESILEEWRAQFLRVDIRPAHVMREIIVSTRADWLFKLNFIILFCNIMGGCKTNGVCDVEFVECLSRNTRFSEIDWCGYILDCLKDSKRSWKRQEKQSFYSGPISLLVVCITLLIFYILC